VLETPGFTLALTDMKNTLNVFLNKTLQRERRKCFLKQ